MRVENYTGHVTKIPIMMANNQTGAVTEKIAVILHEGVNEVDPALWAECEKIAYVKSLQDMGFRRGGIVAGDPKVSLRNLDALKPQIAIDTVEDTMDAKLLASWRLTERRESVLKAIDAQAKKLDPHVPTNTVKL